MEDLYTRRTVVIFTITAFIIFYIAGKNDGVEHMWVSFIFSGVNIHILSSTKKEI